MPLPTPVFSSMMSSVLSIFCQSPKHVFSPIGVNRKLPASGLFVSLGTQTATLVPKVFPVWPFLGSSLLSGSKKKEQNCSEAQLKEYGPLKSGIQNQG